MGYRLIGMKEATRRALDGEDVMTLPTNKLTRLDDLTVGEVREEGRLFLIESEEEAHSVPPIAVKEAPEVEAENGSGGHPPKRKRGLDVGKVMALKNAGWSAAKIADEMGCRVTTVNNAVVRYRKAKKEKEGKE